MDAIRESLSKVWSEWVGLNAQWQWIGEVFAVVLCVVLINFIIRLLLKYLNRKVDKTTNVWDDSVFNAIRTPLTTFVWVLGLSIALDLVQFEEGFDFSDITAQVRRVGVMLAIAWFLVRLIREVSDNIIAIGREDPDRVDSHTVEAIAKLLRLTVIITVVLVVLQTLGVSVSGVLAFGGIGGIAIGFAAKDLLANFFGGLMIYLDRPFSVGQWIRSPDRNIEGTVEKIGWRQTVIRTFDKRPLYVPNSVFTTIAVENPSRMFNRRICETIGIRYSDADQVADIVETIHGMLRHHPEIDQDQTLIVNFNGFGSSSLNIYVYTFTKTTDWVRFHAIKHEILLAIHTIVREHKADFAFPTQTLDLPEHISIQSQQ